METTPTNARQEQFVLDHRTAELLARAARRLGDLDLLERTWLLWPGFAAGPLVARAAVPEVQCIGSQADLTALLALGPRPQPARGPTRTCAGRRDSCSLCGAWRRSHPTAP